MRIGGRDVGRIKKALTRPEYYKAVLRSFQVYAEPLDGLRRYLSGKGDYPCDFGLKLPTGPRSVRLYSLHDMQTVNEVFCRGDYEMPGDFGTVVDLGSNIGISALYFLSRGPRGKVHLFEPVPRNIERLRAQLVGFEDRYVLHTEAVGVSEGEVEFATEPSGRYGGVAEALGDGRVAKVAGERITVTCVDVERVLGEILAESGAIDALKIDVEGLEEAILERLSPGTLARIGRIFAEVEGEGPELPGFTRRRVGGVLLYERKAG